MSNLTTVISVQIDKEDKEQATEILQKLGVSMSGLINMTIKQLIMRKSIPFDVSISNEETDLKQLLYIKEHPSEYNKYDNTEDLKKALLSDDEL